MNVLDKINELSADKKKFSLIILAGIILIYCDVAFLATRQFKAVEAMTPKIKNAREELRELAELKQLKVKQPNIIKDMLKKAKRLITEEQIPELLQGISNMARNNEVSIQQINTTKDIKEVKVPKAKVPPKGKETVAAPESGKFKSMLITMEIQAGYHNLGRFINELERAPEFIAVEEIRISSIPSTYTQQRVDLTLKTYVKK